MTENPRITADEIKIGDWYGLPGDRCGDGYRAAYVGEAVLTGPEHAHLSDEDLLAEAMAEARRADILIETTNLPETESGALSLDTVSVGDTLIRRDPRGKLHLVKVARVTAKQIGAGGYRFRKVDGGEIGSGSRYHSSDIRMPQPGEVERLTKEAEERAAASAVARVQQREALRGRTAGFLTAALDALRSALAAEPGEHAVGDRLEMAVYDALYALESAEKGVRSTAESLRRQAEELDRAVERDADYVGMFHLEAMFGARAEEEKRAAAVKNGRQVVRLVAAFLGVEFTELVTPMAAPAPAEGAEGGAS